MSLLLPTAPLNPSVEPLAEGTKGGSPSDHDSLGLEQEEDTKVLLSPIKRFSTEEDGVKGKPDDTDSCTEPLVPLLVVLPPGPALLLFPSGASKMVGPAATEGSGACAVQLTLLQLLVEERTFLCH